MKKILPILALLLVSLTANAQAALNVKINGIYYTLDSLSLTAEVSKNPDYSGSVSIPSTVSHEGYTYRVTSIGHWAFHDCTGLTSVKIGNNVKSIGYYAFSDCTGLTFVTIGNNVKIIGSEAFQGCSSLTSVTIPNSVTFIEEGAFGNCTGLTTVTIGKNVKGLMPATFAGCASLTSVTIGNSVTSIGEWAFYGCAGLTSITLPNSVTSIGLRAFSGCSSLTSITIPNSVTSIGSSAFQSCTSLTSVTIGNSVKSIRYWAFRDCSSLTSVIIGNSVTSIDYGAFESCSGLTSINIPNSVKKIVDDAFYGCTGLTSVTIGNGMTSITDGIFTECPSLTSVTIGNSVTSIGEWAFYGCAGLTSVTVKNPTPVTIGQNTFSNHANATLYVPTGSKFAYQAADCWKEFKEIVEKDMSHDAGLGDVNGDGTISINDIAMIVNHILGVTDSNFIMAYADVDGDGEISINDVMGAVNIILGGYGGGIDDTSHGYLTCPDDHHPHMIDLGLPSGTKWACCNVGADKPEAYGGYYAWGETEEKDFYYWNTYKYWTDSDDDGYADEYEVTNLGSDIAGTQYDVAHVKWGGSWVMPSEEQLHELLMFCKLTKVNGVEGSRFTSILNGGTIFLPLEGYDDLDPYLYYWSSTLYNIDMFNMVSYPYHMYFYSGHGDLYHDLGGHNGLFVRPVWVP